MIFLTLIVIDNFLLTYLNYYIFIVIIMCNVGSHSESTTNGSAPENGSK